MGKTDPQFERHIPASSERVSAMAKDKAADLSTSSSSGGGSFDEKLGNPSQTTEWTSPFPIPVDSEHKAKVLRPWTATRPHHLSFHLNWICFLCDILLDVCRCTDDLYHPAGPQPHTEGHRRCQCCCYHRHHLCPPDDGPPHQQVWPALRHGLPAAAVVLRHLWHAPGQLLGCLHRLPLHHRLQPVFLCRLPVLDQCAVHCLAGWQRQRSLWWLGKSGRRCDPRCDAPSSKSHLQAPV